MSTDIDSWTPPKDPGGTLVFPPTLPLEIALRTDTIKNICEAYEIDRAAYEKLRVDPRFVAAVIEASEMVKRDGVSFKLRAKVQAEAYLASLWELAHDRENAPAKVRADIMLATIGFAGYDISGNKGTAAGPSLSISIDLSVSP